MLWHVQQGVSLYHCLTAAHPTGGQYRNLTRPERKKGITKGNKQLWATLLSPIVTGNLGKRGRGKAKARERERERERELQYA